MKWIYALVLGLILMATPVMNAQTASSGNDKFVVPKQQILGADDVVPLGDIVILKISPIDGVNTPKYLKEVQYNWTVLKNGKKLDRFLPWPDNSSLVFGGGIDPKVDIKVLLSIAYRYEVVEDVKDKDGKVIGKVIKESAIRLAPPILAQVKVGDGPPGPNPPGPNPPDPAPVFPAGKYGLSKIAYDAAVVVNLDSASKQRSALALAANYNGIASSIAAGAVTSPVDALTKTKAGNGAALASVNVSNGAWNPWDDIVEKQLDKFNKVDKTLLTVQDIATAWKEIAVGLSAVK